MLDDTVKYPYCPRRGRIEQLSVVLRSYFKKENNKKEVEEEEM